MAERTLDYELIRNLHAKGLNDSEIARELHASLNGIIYARRDVMKLPRNIKTYTLTPEMESVLVGTLIGDAWIGYNVHSRFPQYQCGHTEKQKEYLDTIYRRLQPIMTPSITRYEGGEGFAHGRKFVKHVYYSMRSRNCECLIPYRAAFYPNGKGVIPIEFIRDKFTALSLAYWFLDDGSKDINSNSYVINTQAYTRENLQEFIDFLKEKFGLLFTIKKDKSLYLKHCCNDLFENLISKYVTPDMQYKLCRRKTPLNKETPDNRTILC